MARYGSPLSLPSRLQTVTRVVPVDSARHEEWVLDQLDPAAPEALLASYDDVVRELGRGGLVQRHYVVARWPLTSQFTAAAARYGDGLEGWIALMEQQTGAVARHLSAARFRGVHPLSAAQLAAVLAASSASGLADRPGGRCAAGTMDGQPGLVVGDHGREIWIRTA